MAHRWCFLSLSHMIFTETLSPFWFPKLDLCEGGSCSPTICNSDMQLSVSPTSCFISVCPFVALLKATYAKNVGVADGWYVLTINCLSTFYTPLSLFTDNPPHHSHVLSTARSHEPGKYLTYLLFIAHSLSTRSQERIVWTTGWFSW